MSNWEGPYQPPSYTPPTVGGGSYDPARSSAKDRVRFYIDDRKAPYRFQDAEITASLASGAGEVAELTAAIELLESELIGGGFTKSRRQGSWAESMTVQNAERRIELLRERLASANAAVAGSSTSAIGLGEVPDPQPTPTPWPDSIGRGPFG